MPVAGEYPASMDFCNPTDEERALFDSKTQRQGECLLWIAGKNDAGYGLFWYRKKMVRTNRLALAWYTGDCPTGLKALHECGIPACVNPKHLRWGTQRQNCEDMRRHGTAMLGLKNHQAKLTPADIKKIHSLISMGELSQRAIGEMFGVSQSTISLVALSQIWQDHTKKLEWGARKPVYDSRKGKLVATAKLDDEKVRHIRKQGRDGVLPMDAARRLALRYGVHTRNIRAAFHGESWKHVT